MSNYVIKKKKNSVTIKKPEAKVQVRLHFGEAAEKILDKLEKNPGKKYPHKKTSLAFSVKPTPENFKLLQSINLTAKLDKDNLKSQYCIVTGRKKVLAMLDKLEKKLNLSSDYFSQLRADIKQQFLAERPPKSKHINAYKIIEEKPAVEGSHDDVKIVAKKGNGKQGVYKKNKKDRKISELEAAIGALYRILLVSHTPKTTSVYNDNGYLGVVSDLISNAQPLRNAPDKNINRLSRYGLLRIFIAAYILEENDLHYYNILYDKSSKLYKIDHDRALWGISSKYYGHDPNKARGKKPAPVNAFPITVRDIKEFPGIEDARPRRWAFDQLDAYKYTLEEEKEKYKWFLNVILVGPLSFKTHIEEHIGSKKMRETVTNRIQQRLTQLENILLELPEFQETVLNNPNFLAELISEYQELNKDFKNEKYAALRIDIEAVKQRYHSMVAQFKFNKAEGLYQRENNDYVDSLQLWYESINTAIQLALKANDKLLITFKQKILSTENHPAKQYLLSNLDYLGLTKEQDLIKAKNHSCQFSDQALQWQSKLFSQLLLDNNNSYSIHNQNAVITAYIRQLLSRDDVINSIKYFNVIKSALIENDKDKILATMLAKFDAFISLCQNNISLPKHERNLWASLADFYQNFSPNDKEKITYCCMMDVLHGNKNGLEKFDNAPLSFDRNLIEKQILKQYLVKIKTWIRDANLLLERYREITNNNRWQKFLDSNPKKCKISLEQQLIYAYDIEGKLTERLKNNKLDNWQSLVEQSISKSASLKIPENLKLDFSKFQQACLENLSDIQEQIQTNDNKTFESNTHPVMIM